MLEIGAGRNCFRPALLVDAASTPTEITTEMSCRRFQVSCRSGVFREAEYSGSKVATLRGHHRQVAFSSRESPPRTILEYGYMNSGAAVEGSWFGQEERSWFKDRMDVNRSHGAQRFRSPRGAAEPRRRTRVESAIGENRGIPGRARHSRGRIRQLRQQERNAVVKRGSRRTASSFIRSIEPPHCTESSAVSLPLGLA